jgi:[acyl-carrier-protein] S-malonyltransferase
MKLAMMFPGQGSQSKAMMTSFEAFPVVRDTFGEASMALGEDLWTLVENGPDEALNRTVNTQPVMLAADIAVYRAWRAAGGVAPTVLAGHSLGEYAALVAAGALKFADAVPLVRFRAEAMQEAVPAGVGAMAAVVGLDVEALSEACREAALGQIVEPVNFNSIDQIVIAGHREAVERAVDAARARGARRAVLLPVSAPFHSLLMKPAAERLAEHLRTVAIDAPTLPVIHNFDVSVAGTPDSIRAALAAQAASPVRWVETIRAFAARGVTHVVECGPGKVLTGLAKRIAPEMTALPMNDAEAMATAIAATSA